MPEKSGWGTWIPRLFFHFDPYQSFLARSRWNFRTAEGEELFDVDDVTELLLLGYAAVKGISKELNFGKREWQFALKQAEEVAWKRAQDFDWNVYTHKDTERLQLIEWSTVSNGSVGVMFLHDALLANEAPAERATQLWCMLCLMWIDQAIYYLTEDEAHRAVDCVLRANEALAKSTPRLTIAEARSQMARAGVAKKLELDPTQATKRKARVIWSQMRGHFKTKADLARHVQDLFPDLVNINVITRWFREWEQGG